ncbi:MAG: hypothetical protein ACOYKZ_06100 [Chlamydiia bacterium]
MAVIYALLFMGYIAAMRDKRALCLAFCLAALGLVVGVFFFQMTDLVPVRF